MARAIAVPVTSPALNPLDDFQPRDRQLTFGVAAACRHRRGDLSVEYRRELDPTPDYLVSEPAAAAAEIRPTQRLRLSAGAEYDFANGWWGSAEGGASYLTSRFQLTGEIRRYRPFFDLWTVWGAFSPVPYHAIRASGSARPVEGVWIRLQGERYWFEETATETPLVTAEDRGWRAAAIASAALGPRWTTEGGLRGEFGPGAASRTLDLGVTHRPSEALVLAARAGTLERPLEFRYADARLRWLSLSGDLAISRRLRLVADAGCLEISGGGRTRAGGTSINSG